MKARARIICVGNPYHGADWVGSAVFQALAAIDLEAEVALVDGGLQGLNLLHLMEDVERVVFADTLLPGEGPDPDAPRVLADPFDGPSALGFDHGGGLSYLLQVAPRALERLPAVWVAGAGARAPRQVVAPLAQACLDLARSGKHGLG